MPADRRPVRIGVGGPVGTGKTSLVAALCRALATELSIAVVTNDIYTTEDAQLLRRAGVLAQERIEAVRTGGCPHTAIRDDVSGNLEAIAELERRVAGVDLVLIESGGDNLTAVFSPALADRQLFVIDVAGGDDIPRKGGPGIERSDLLVINKRDLAPYVRADPDLMVREARERRAGRPVALVSLVEDPEAAPVAAWVRAQVELARAGRLEPAPAMPHRHTHSHSHVHVAHFSTEGG